MTGKSLVDIALSGAWPGSEEPIDQVAAMHTNKHVTASCAPEGRLEDKVGALLLVCKLMHALLQGALGDQPVDCHRQVCRADAMSHGEGLHIPPGHMPRHRIIDTKQVWYWFHMI